MEYTQTGRRSYITDPGTGRTAMIARKHIKVLDAMLRDREVQLFSLKARGLTPRKGSMHARLIREDETLRVVLSLLASKPAVEDRVAQEGKAS